MTSAEMRAFNAGVLAVLDLARATSAALAPRLVQQPTRINFAMEALDTLADEGRALLLQVPIALPPRPPTTMSHLE